MDRQKGINEGTKERKKDRDERKKGETKGGIDPWTANQLTTRIIAAPLTALDDETSS